MQQPETSDANSSKTVYMPERAAVGMQMSADGYVGYLRHQQQVDL